MSKTIKRSLYLAEINNILAWYNEFKDTKQDDLPIRIQWNLLSAIKEIQPAAARFEEFRNQLVNKLQEEFFDEEHSEETTIPKTDANGNQMLGEDGEVLTENGRRVKSEYLEQYQDRVQELNTELNNLLVEKTTYTFKGIDLDEFIDTLDNESKLGLTDLDMLSFIDIHSSDNGDE